MYVYSRLVIITPIQTDRHDAQSSSQLDVFRKAESSPHVNGKPLPIIELVNVKCYLSETPTSF